MYAAQVLLTRMIVSYAVCWNTVQLNYEQITCFLT